MMSNIEPVNPSDRINIFENIKKYDNQSKEFWFARELATALGYSEYRNFKPVIERAQQACFNSAQEVKDHFVQMNEMVDIGSNAKREIDDIMLSRYACYLIAQNGDPSKEVIARAQTYFALQTRRQELGDLEQENMRRMKLREEIKSHNKKLAGVAREAGVVAPKDFAIFQNHGYMGLYGGLTMQDIHRRKDFEKKEHILDHMGSTELAANLFRATQAEDKIRREKINGKEKANAAHKEVGQKVRKIIKEIGGTMPEDLPKAENIKKISSKRRKKLK